MASLPTVGGSAGVWGSELSTWLLVGHNADGTTIPVPQLTPTAIKTGAYTVVNGDAVPVDASGGTINITVPSAPADKFTFAVKMVKISGSNVVNINLSGTDKFNAGTSTTFVLRVLDHAVVAQYSLSAGVFYIWGDDVPLSQLDARYARVSNNLSDVTAATARTNLGLGSAATLASAAVVQTANNLSDVTAATARTNLGLGSAATQASSAFMQAANNLSEVSSKATARDNLGAFHIVHAKADFGVVGDNSTDDTANLQSFLTAIAVGGSKSGHKGYLPPGTYKITDALVGGSLTQLVGGGKYVTTIKQWTANKDVLKFNTGSNMLGVELSDFSLTGTYRVDKTGTATHSSTTVDDTNAVASDVGQSISGSGIPGGATISSVTPGASYVISAAATTSLTNPALTIGGTSTGVGLNLNFWLDTCSAKRMIIQGNGSHGVLLQNSYLISFDEVWHYNNGGDGLHAVTSLNAVRWSGCEFFGNAGDGAYVSGVAGSAFLACDFETNGKNGLETTNCYALTVEASDFENNGTLTANTYDAIYVGSTNGYAGPRIVGNNFTGTGNQTANGVHLSASVTSAFVEGCPFNNFANADILVDSGATGVIIAPNCVHQAGSEPLVIDSSTSGITYLGELQSHFSATDAGYKAWNYDFAMMPNLNSSTGMVNYTAGVPFGARIQVRHVMTVSKISCYWVQPTGSGPPANCFLALYDSAGNRKGVTADLTSTVTGLIQPAFAGGAVTLQPGYYYVAVLIGTQGGTQAGGVAYPTLTLVSNQATGYQGAGLSASQYRWAKLGNLTAQTSMPSSITLANNVSTSLPFGCAIL